MNVKHNIPVTLFDYHKGDNPLYSLAKLKIFYVGMTPDRRVFTKEFSDELLKTLPYVPVVGHYNSEDGDFEGHSANQNIYGIVPESTNVEFVEEDEKQYAVCDVILYTGRKDETGEIAEKIVGKPHSLELDPDTTTYDIIEDDEGEIDFIEFKTGSLLGLSVLGDEERPAFTGSEFFKDKEGHDIAEILNGCKAEWAKYNDENNKQRGNEEMEFNLLKSYESFMEKAYDEKFEELAELLSKEFEYFNIIQMFNEYLVVMTYNPSEEKFEYYKISYSSEESQMSLGEKEFVYPRYLTTDEANELESFEDNAGNEEDEEASDTDDETEQENFNSNEDLGEEEEEETDNEADDDNEEFTSQDEETEEEDEEEQEESENFEELNTTTLTDSERKELETFRREKRLNLINSFEDDLEEDYLDDIKKKVDEYTYDDLETELSKEFTRTKKQESSNKAKFNPAMYSLGRKRISDEEEDAKLIREYANKQ